MAIEFTESAGKHGFTLGDAVNAIANTTYQALAFEESRVTGRVAPDLYIGPALDGTVIEVLSETIPPRTLVIFHVMPVRQKTLAHFIGRRPR